MTAGSDIQISGLQVRYGQRTVLDLGELRIDPGERVGVLGPSGSGKSTLLRCLAGLERPTAGEIHLGGRLATRGGRHLLAPHQRNMAMVFQDLGLWPHLSIRQTLRFCAARPDAVEAMVARLGLQGREGARPGELSGGEQQRLALGRALVAEPEVLLLDEPFTALDLVLKRDLLRMLDGLQQELGFSLIQVTHDPAEALRVSGRVVLLEAGQRVWDGPARDLGGLDRGLGRELAQALRWWREDPTARAEPSAPTDPPDTAEPPAPTDPSDRNEVTT